MAPGAMRAMRKQSVAVLFAVLIAFGGVQVWALRNALRLQRCA
jgi:hypothetical protein